MVDARGPIGQIAKVGRNRLRRYLLIIFGTADQFSVSVQGHVDQAALPSFVAAAFIEAARDGQALTRSEAARRDNSRSCRHPPENGRSTSGQIGNLRSSSRTSIARLVDGSCATSSTILLHRLVSIKQTPPSRAELTRSDEWHGLKRAGSLETGATHRAVWPPEFAWLTAASAARACQSKEAGLGDRPRSCIIFRSSRTA